MRNPHSVKILKDDECFEIVRKKLIQDSMDHYNLTSYEVIPLTACNGYMGQYFILRATVTCPKSSDTRSMKFFTKLPPFQNSPQHEFNQEMGTFKKEVALYKTVFPEVLAGLDQRCIPQCFLGLDDAVIVLEDMTHSGFKMCNKYEPFDYEHCVIMMRTLGKFHAKSVIYEAQGKKSLQDDFSHCMQETLWPLTGNRATSMFKAAVKGLLSMVDLVSDFTAEQRKKLKEKLAGLTSDHVSKLLPSNKFKNVLCHGDLWANNLLFKYDLNGKPMACCLIDFQLARYNPPAHDILCFLQFTTTQKLRSEHFDDLLKIYYESISSSLEESSLDATEVFPMSELTTSISELRTMCMVHGILNIPIMLLDEDAVGKYFVNEPERLEEVLYCDRTPLICQQYRQVPSYHERLREALLELNDHIFS